MHADRIRTVVQVLARHRQTRMHLFADRNALQTVCYNFAYNARNDTLGRIAKAVCRLCQVG